MKFPIGQKWKQVFLSLFITKIIIRYHSLFYFLRKKNEKRKKWKKGGAPNKMRQSELLRVTWGRWSVQVLVVVIQLAFEVFAPWDQATTRELIIVLPVPCLLTPHSYRLLIIRDPPWHWLHPMELNRAFLVYRHDQSQ